MKSSTLDQFAVGLWLSMAAGAGIMLRSYQAPTAILLLAFFSLAPRFASLANKSIHRSVRLAGKCALVACIALFSLATLLGAERLYYSHAKPYPEWLIDGHLTADMSLRELRDDVCAGRSPVEITARDDGRYLLRCGFLWIGSKLYTSSSLPLELSP